MSSTRHIHLKETDSTNKALRELVDNGSLSESMSFVTASFQTAGKGQVGNSWESEAGKNLLISSLYIPKSPLDVSLQFYISMAVSLSVCEVVWSATKGGIIPKIKWPNDIYVGDFKLAGILIENRLRGREIADSIIGLGLNINQRQFVSDAPNPISLSILSDGRNFPIDGICSAYIASLDAHLAAIDDQRFDVLLTAYHQLLYHGDGNFYPFSDANGCFSAKIVNVLEDGHLILADSSGKIRKYLFKEVSFGDTFGR